MSESIISISKAEWEKSYKPIRNPLDPSKFGIGPSKREIALLDDFEPRYI